MSQQLAKNDLTAVLYSAKDAKRFLKENPSADRVFTFTPDALATIKNIDIPLLTTLDTYKNYGQRRVLARVRRMEKQLNYDYADLKISLSSKKPLNL